MGADRAGEPVVEDMTGQEQQSAAPPAVAAVGRLRPLALRVLKDQRFAFLVVGGVNTLVGFGWFVLFEVTIGRIWGYMATLVASHITGVICAFLMQRRFVFRVRGHWWRDLARFELVQLVAFGFNLVALPLLVSVVGIPPIPSQAIVLAVTVVFSYFAHRYFSFRRKEHAP